MNFIPIQAQVRFKQTIEVTPENQPKYNKPIGAEVEEELIFNGIILDVVILNTASIQALREGLSGDMKTVKYNDVAVPSSNLQFIFAFQKEEDYRLSLVSPDDIYIAPREMDKYVKMKWQSLNK
jgi:hypothetical protein